MKLIIHAGMHKTGSSSIQQTLARLPMPGRLYFDWELPNHSTLFALLFHEPVEEYRLFKSNGDTRQALLAKRAEWQDKIKADLAGSGAEIAIFSAEEISGRYHDAVERMRDFFEPLVDEIEVLAYVRPPVSSMQSAFQQAVKGNGMKRLRMEALWPHYRRRLDMLDTVFGSERVRLKKFDRKSLDAGNVVIDFGHEIGVEIPEDRIIQSNESLSLEALALLFAQRRLGEGLVTGFSGALRANNRFINALRGIGSGKLAFAPELVDPVLQAHAEDLAWAEARLGQPLRDSAKTDGRLIATEEDLLAIAAENQAELAECLLEEIRAGGQGGPRRKLLRNLELLRTLHV